MKKESRFQSQDLPCLIRTDKATHEKLKKLKRKLKKSMAQIVIDLVTQFYEESMG